MDRSDVTLERMRSFVRVAERGSLSAVAREFGVGQSTITRHLRELEDALGVALISRTTRRLALTAEGLAYYENSLRILHLVEQAGAEARDRRDAPAGTVRLSCTAALGVLHVGAIVFAFQDRYPDISVDLSLTDERVDLVREGMDLAIRLGPLADSALRLRAVGRSERRLVAAPAYLAARGRPLTPEDLVGHEGIRMTNVARERYPGPRRTGGRAPRGALRRPPPGRSRAGRAGCGPGQGGASRPRTAGSSRIASPTAGSRRSCRTTPCRRCRSAC